MCELWKNNKAKYCKNMDKFKYNCNENNQNNVGFFVNEVV